MKENKVIFNIFLVLNFFNPAFADDDILGIWGGIAVQNSGAGAWTIKMNFSKDGYRIDYPSIPCGGELDLLSSDGYKYIFREKITKDKDNKCVNNGTLILTKLDSDTLGWDWYLPNGTKDAHTEVNKYLDINDYNLEVPKLLADYNQLERKYSNDDSVERKKRDLY